VLYIKKVVTASYFDFKFLQMHLLALADTVASCKINLSDRFAIDAAKAAISKETSTGGDTTPGTYYKE